MDPPAAEREETGLKKHTIPAWLLRETPPKEGSSALPRPKGSGTHFLRRTLRALTGVAENDFRCERYAGLPLLLQNVDARVKLPVLLFYAVLGGAAPGLGTLAGLVLVALLYAKLSGIAMGEYIRRVWLYVPTLVLLFSLPGATGAFVHSAPLFTLHAGGLAVSFSAAGLMMALRAALRAGVSLSFASLLLLTTRWTKITRALASLHVPSVFTAVLDMAYRYLFVAASLAANMMEARFLRTAGLLRARSSRRFLGRSMAALFVRTGEAGEAVYDAMRCRGFSGKPVRLGKSRLQGADALFLVSSLLIALLLLFIGRPA